MYRKLAVVVWCLFLAACSSHGRPALFSLPLVHLNDTHSHLEPVNVTLRVNGEKTTAELGGFARLKTVINQLRAENPDLLLLHAGDAVQGTLYFTLFNGTPEFDFLNLLGVDAMTFGNHEFDRGTAPLPGWINRSRFPWLSANIDFSGEAAVAPLTRPYLVKTVRGEKIGIIGVTTETTPLSTLNVGKAVFKDAAESTRRQVAILTAQGVNKIILLSHLGYQRDLQLASQVSGLDIIVGGHSHSLLGNKTELALIGLVPEGSYPTELKGQDGKTVLVLQAWQWGDLLGSLKVDFTPDGEVSGFTSSAVLPVGDRFVRNGVTLSPGTPPYQDIVATLNKTGVAWIVPEDPELAAALAPYTARLARYRTDVIAIAADDLTVGLNSGPGPLAADSMLAAVPKAQVGILNYGGVRRGLATGTVTVGDVLEVLPFANTLVLADLTGDQLRQALEDDIDFLITKFGMQAPAMPYLSGATMTVCLTGVKGRRITSLAIKDANGKLQPVQPDKIYRSVVNAFVAGGGDGFGVIRNSTGFRDDTGIIDSDAFRDYLKNRGRVSNPAEQRIIILPAGESHPDPDPGPGTTGAQR